MPTITARKTESGPGEDAVAGGLTGDGRRILVIVDYFSSPPVYGTAVIAYHWSRILRRRGWAVDLLPVRERWDARWDEFCRAHGIGRGPVTVRWRGRARQALAVLRGLPPALDHVDAAALTRDLTGERYDAILVLGPHLLPLAERLERRHKVVFVPTDAVSMVLESRLDQRPLRPSHARWALEARLWRQVEARRLPRLGASVFVARADADEATREWPEPARDRVHVIPNGVDSDYFSPIDEPEAEAEVVFTGNLWSYDSVRGARWFIDRVLPGVAEAVPGVRFRMVGRDPAPELVEAAERDARVRIDANVPDIRPYLGRAAVYVCPLFSGGGVKNRLLEAMAMARPAVTTPDCAAALELRDGEAVRAAGDVPSFTRAVVDLLDDEAGRRRLGDEARDVVLDRFSWEAGVARLERIIDAL